MEKRNKVIVSFAFLVVLIMGLYFFSDWFSKMTGFLIEDEEEEFRLVKCLSEKGVKLYGTNKCPNCKKQKDILGDGFKFIKYEECNGDIGKCQNLRGVPAWEINGNIIYGVRSLEELSRITGCSNE